MQLSTVKIANYHKLCNRFTKEVELNSKAKQFPPVYLSVYTFIHTLTSNAQGDGAQSFWDKHLKMSQFQFIYKPKNCEQFLITFGYVEPREINDGGRLLSKYTRHKIFR